MSTSTPHPIGKRRKEIGCRPRVTGSMPLMTAMLLPWIVLLVRSTANPCFMTS